MGFIEDEGEYSGLQVVLVPYYDGEKTKQKILWRSAGPFLNTPLLLDIIEDKNCSGLSCRKDTTMREPGR
jgi:hypothetical protein